MDEKIILWDMIDGVTGTFQGVTENGHSKMVMPLYKPYGPKGLLGKTKFRNGALELNERQIIHLDLPGHYPGQPKRLCVLVPSEGLKDVVYEKTIFYKIFKDSNMQLSEVESKLKRMQAKCSQLERELREEKERNEIGKHQRQSGIVCPNCNNRFSIDEIRSTGGLCPECKVPIIGFQRS